MAKYVYEHKNWTAFTWQDKAMASAIIDRIVHHAHILKFAGDSYRIKDFSNQFNNIV